MSLVCLHCRYCRVFEIVIMLVLKVWSFDRQSKRTVIVREDGDLIAEGQ